MTYSIRPLLLVATLLGPACAFSQNPQVTTEPRQFPLEKERAMGQQYAKEILREAKLVEDAIVIAQVDRVAKAIAERCPPGHQIEVRVLVADEPNAFAVPGGFLFVNTGLIRGADTESELAAVLGHLVSYVQAGPAVRAARGGAGDPTIPLVYMGGPRGHGYRPGPGPDALAPLGFLSHYRDRVSEADLGGARCLAETAYDPQGMLRSLEKIRNAEAGNRHSSHPPAAERLQAVQSVLDALPPKPDRIVTTHQYAELRSRVEMLYPPAREHARSEREARKGPPRLRR